jgi:uncharacterized protein YktB (UPF0637 family)
MELFVDKDFRVFDIAGFELRMKSLAGRIRPKLESIGEELAPVVASIVDQPVFVHVARHARRTVNPPDDTWAAIAGDKRGYKKDVHFKIAVSRNCVRLLFEVGPEYYDKGEWALEWKREARLVREALGGSRKLSWFRDEHDEDPARSLAAFSVEELVDLGRELTRRRDGQLVLGRRIDRKEFLAMTPAAFRRVAMATFKPMALLFSLHSARKLAAVR